MYPEEKLTPAQIAQEARKQEAAARSAFEERERENREKIALEQKKFQDDLVRAQEEEKEVAIEKKRETDIEEGNRVQSMLREGADAAVRMTSSGRYTGVDEIRQDVIDAVQLEASAFAENVKETLIDAGRKEAQDFLVNKGYTLDLDEIQNLEDKPPTEPSFPIAMIFFAIIKDTLDILDLTMIGIFFKIIYVPIYFIIMIVWTLSLTSRFSFMGKVGVKIMRNAVLKRLAAVTTIEAVPLVSVLPLATVFVLLNHYSNTKVVQFFMKASEMIARKGEIEFGERG